jgi:hypothetical protein
LRGFIHGSFKEFEVEPMGGSKIPPIDLLCVLLFKNLKRRIFTEGNGGNEGAARGFILDSLGTDGKVGQWLD